MSLSFDSPRFSLRNADFPAMRAALDATGHVVLTEAWNAAFLARVLEQAEQCFAADDRDRERIVAERSQLGSYIGGVTHRYSVLGDPAFLPEFERTGLTSFLRNVFAGDFVIDNTHQAVRRADPGVGARFTGLHRDFQLDEFAAAGIRSKRAVTIWTPLADCTDETTPRLLLFDLHDRPDDRPPSEAMLGTLHDPEHSPVSPEQLDDIFDGVFRSHRCFAPHVPLGGLVLFDHQVFHGTYRHSAMRKIRYSFDVRAVGEYPVTIPDTDGIVFRQGGFRPPPPAPPPPPPPAPPALATRLRALLRPYLKPVRDYVRANLLKPH